MSRFVRRPALALAFAAFAATFGAASVCGAVEREWHVGGSFGYAMLDFPRALPRHGFGGGVNVRYGLNDAIDLTMNASLFGYETDDRIAPATSVGISYVVDISRWIPTIGGTIGFMDLVAFRCDAEPIRCGHMPILTLGIPATFEFRVVPEVPIGVRFEYQFLFLGTPGTQMFVGVYGAFAK